MNVEKEVREVVGFIKELGKPNAKGQYVLTFGDYFNCDDVQNTLENPFATLRAAKKRGVIDFEGEMLWQGQHNHVELILLNENY
ncbi:hypothetical protein NDN08_001983 [Rhodosorus marinus]|uniref:Costars domain-containing protein n=1 Tax=Rhodosorus marinus TaxID=101924 RepID=A0AAV8UVC7_9RHOD|nr:hypothetical protein NDN08_001983 [Rhodosorus marinus]|mmetsp:Transcript_12925/g.18575  ORF Transcript_12925/g.18575 Transcript_12925/m.18575 type:complete len:84 (-) Transcript_12925:9-260(-)